MGWLCGDSICVGVLNLGSSFGSYLSLDLDLGLGSGLNLDTGFVSFELVLRNRCLGLELVCVGFGLGWLVGSVWHRSVIAVV